MILDPKKDEAQNNIKEEEGSPSTYDSDEDIENCSKYTDEAEDEVENRKVEAKIRMKEKAKQKKIEEEEEKAR